MLFPESPGARRSGISRCVALLLFRSGRRVRSRPPGLSGARPTSLASRRALPVYVVRRGRERLGERRGRLVRVARAGVARARPVERPAPPPPPRAPWRSAAIVARNLPVVVEGAIAHWPASRGWSPEHMASRAGESALISVNVTPNGLGDALLATDGVEVVRRTPTTRGMMMMMMTLRPRPAGRFRCEERCDDLPRVLGRAEPHARASERTTRAFASRTVSRQCGSLREEFALAAPVRADLEWANAAFGAAPDAVNLGCATSAANDVPPGPLREHLLRHQRLEDVRARAAVPGDRAYARRDAPAATFEGAAVVLESPRGRCGGGRTPSRTRGWSTVRRKGQRNRSR